MAQSYRNFLRSKQFHIRLPKALALTKKDNALLLLWGSTLEAIASGKLKPINPNELAFAKFVSGHKPPTGKSEIAWFNLIKRRLCCTDIRYWLATNPGIIQQTDCIQIFASEIAKKYKFNFVGVCKSIEEIWGLMRFEELFAIKHKHNASQSIEDYEFDRTQWEQNGCLDHDALYDLEERYWIDARHELELDERCWLSEKDYEIWLWIKQWV